MSEASEVESLTDRLLGVIARWLQEAKRFRDSAKEAPPHQLFDQAVLSWEIQASIFEKCAKQISEALQKAEGE